MPGSSDQNDKTQTHLVLSKGVQVSHYRIIEKIGAGGMGEVYLAEDTKLGRKVALKFIPSQYVNNDDTKTRFIREAQATAALSHPNIIHIYEVSEYKGRPFFAMELIEGQSLHEMIRKNDLSVSRVVEIGIQVCEGLAEAHEAGIIHRDIKPANILLGKKGRARLVDFGLAKIGGGIDLTKSGSTLGTIGYMAPEQVRGESADQRSDIFAFGVVLYEMITGRQPLRRDSEAATLHAIVNETPDPLARYKADVPPGLQNIVSKALDKDLETRYQTASDMLADLKREKKIAESAAGIQPLVTPAPPSRSPTGSRRLLLPGFIVVAAVVLLVALLHWRFGLGPAQEAAADTNRLAVMYLDNLAEQEDNRRLSEIITNLLITDLSESSYIQVVSTQRLYDILKLLGKEGTKKVDRNIATQVAEKAGAQWMLLGSILQVEPRIIITTQLVDVRSGHVMASQRITGEIAEEVFSLVDKLTVEIKADLSLPAAAREEPDPEIADVTTHSPEAYRHYLSGIDCYYKLYNEEAEQNFKKALEFDSTFAMAYYWLSMRYRGLEQKTMIAKAVEYSEKASRKEKLYIDSRQAFILGDYSLAVVNLQKISERFPEEKEAYYRLGTIHYYALRQPEEAVRYYSEAIKIDPLYKLVYNYLAYAYDQIGDFERSIWAINKYISLAPDEANPYDSRGELYAANGRIGPAIESFKKALMIKPDYFMSLRKLGYMYVFNQEYARAESCYKKLSSSTEKDLRSAAKTYLALIPVYRGKFEEALAVLDDGIAADKMEQVKELQRAWKHIAKATIYEEQNRLDLALPEVETGMEIWRKDDPNVRIYWQHYYILLLAKSGNFARAEEIAEELKQELLEKDPTLMHYYSYAIGCIEFFRGNFDGSVKYLAEAAKPLVNRLPGHYFEVHMMLGHAYLEAGRLGEAVAEFEALLSNYSYGRAYSALWSVKTHYYLGQAYEKSGWTGKAIEQYEEFLHLWKDADPGIAAVIYARERLTNLKQTS